MVQLAEGRDDVLVGISARARKVGERTFERRNGSD